MIILFVLSLGNFMEASFEKILLIYNTMNYETSDVINTFVYRRGFLMPISASQQRWACSNPRLASFWSLRPTGSYANIRRPACGKGGA